MILDTTTRKIQILLAAAKTTNDCPVLVDYVDRTSSAFTPGITPSNTNGTAAVDVLAAPAASTQRKVNKVSVLNADTATSVVTVRLNDNGTTYIEIVATIQPNETLIFTDTDGWYTLDSQGCIKNSVVQVGSLLKTTVLASGTSFTTDPRTSRAFLRLIAGGGGGGGVSSSAATGAAAGGGAAGGYLEKMVNVLGNTAYTYAIGQGGAGGTSGANDGSAGTNSTFAVGGTTFTANGGSGGKGAAAATSGVALGGAGAAVSTNGDVNGGSEPGEVGIWGSASVAKSGKGGSSIFGGGGNSLKTSSAGSDGIAIGSGGGGACQISNGGAAAGGNGKNGAILIVEYA